MSPGSEAFHAATLEIAWVCTGREQTVARLSLAPISRAAGMDEFLPPQEARRVVPRGMPQGRGGFFNSPSNGSARLRFSRA